MTTVNAHFDGHAIVPDEPLDLAPGERLRVHIERDRPETTKTVRRRAGRLRGKVHLTEAFDAPLKDFEEYQ